MGPDDIPQGCFCDHIGCRTECLKSVIIGIHEHLIADPPNGEPNRKLFNTFYEIVHDSTLTHSMMSSKDSDVNNAVLKL